MVQICARLVGGPDGKPYSTGARSEPRQLWKDKPHPVSALESAADLGKRLAVDVFLSFNEVIQVMPRFSSAPGRATEPAPRADPVPSPAVMETHGFVARLLRFGFVYRHGGVLVASPWDARLMTAVNAEIPPPAASAAARRVDDIPARGRRSRPASHLRSPRGSSQRSGTSPSGERITVRKMPPGRRSISQWSSREPG